MNINLNGERESRASLNDSPGECERPKGLMSFILGHERVCVCRLDIGIELQGFRY